MGVINRRLEMRVNSLLGVTLLTLLTLLVTTAGRRRDIFNILAQGFGDKMVKTVAGKQRMSCGCRQLVISSLGKAAQLQPQAMGIYKSYNQQYSKRPAYMGPGAMRLYYSVQRGYSCWMVSNSLGSVSGY